jgi:hypothetical protein
MLFNRVNGKSQIGDSNNDFHSQKSIHANRIIGSNRDNSFADVYTYAGFEECTGPGQGCHVPAAASAVGRDVQYVFR